MGEGGTIGAPAAIANALTDALMPLGADIFELPMTPERLFRLVGSKRQVSESQCAGLRQRSSSASPPAAPGDDGFMTRK
jgi:carbon-monoxide dehydrogenase large subunit